MSRAAEKYARARLIEPLCRKEKQYADSAAEKYARAPRLVCLFANKMV